MIKNVIAPIQAWLLSQGRCVGCGISLNKGKTKKHENGIQVTCGCGRIFIKGSKGNYRRALINEV